MGRNRNYKSESRWYLPKSNPYHFHGYCFKRFDKVHTNIKELRRATDLPWNVKIKEPALNLLENRIYNYLKHSNKDMEIKTVGGLIELWQEIHFNNISSENKKKYYQSFNHFLDANMLLDSEIIRNDLNRRIINSQLHQNTLNDLLNKVKRVLEFGVAENLIEKNPLLPAMIPNKSRIRYQEITLNEISALLRYFYHNDYEMFLLLLFVRFSGARINEVIKLTWNDILLNRYVLIKGKGNRNRQLPLKSSLFEPLNTVLRHLAKLGNVPYIWRWKNLKTPQLIMRNGMKALNIYSERKLFHSIRAFRENELLYNYKLYPNIVAQIIGHTSVVQNRHYEKKFEADLLADIIDKEVLHRAKNVQNKNKY